MATTSSRTTDSGGLLDVSGVLRTLGRDLRKVLTTSPKTAQELSELIRVGATPPRFDETKELRDVFEVSAQHVKKLQREQEATRTDELSKAIEKRKEALRTVVTYEPVEKEPSEGHFVVVGRVVDKETGSGLPNVAVEAFDLDRKVHDFLGAVRTDDLGYYRIEYTEADLAERDKLPETFIRVLDEQNEVLFTSRKSFIYKAGKIETIDAEVDGAKLPASRAFAGLSVSFLNGRLAAYEARRKVLIGRNAAAIGKPGAGEVVATRATASDQAAPLGRETSRVAENQPGPTKPPSPPTRKATTRGNPAPTARTPVRPKTTATKAAGRAKKKATTKTTKTTKKATKKTSKKKTK